MCIYNFKARWRHLYTSPECQHESISLTRAQYLFTVFFFWYKIYTQWNAQNFKNILMLTILSLNFSIDTLAKFVLFSSVWAHGTYNPWTVHVEMHLPFNFMLEWQCEWYKTLKSLFSLEDFGDSALLEYCYREVFWPSYPLQVLGIFFCWFVCLLDFAWILTEFLRYSASATSMQVWITCGFY